MSDDKNLEEKNDLDVEKAFRETTVDVLKMMKEERNLSKDHDDRSGRSSTMDKQVFRLGQLLRAWNIKIPEEELGGFEEDNLDADLVLGDNVVLHPMAEKKQANAKKK